MLLKAAELEAIASGRVDLVFRRWKRAGVRPGGTLLTAIGQLAIDAVDPVEADAISDEDAGRAGFADARALLAAIPKAAVGDLYRIRLRLAGADPRLALRDTLSGLDETRQALARLDARAPWTAAVLALIGRKPGISAQNLADELGLEKQKFKARVRQLKALGLTESLEVGYRLSPRGEALVRPPTASA